MKKTLLLLMILIPAVAFGQLDTINVGTAANNGTGESLRSAMLKTNNLIQAYNAAYLYRLTLANYPLTLTTTASTNVTLPTNGTLATTAQVATKQDVLVSGTNIKTINGTTLLGGGDMTIGTGGTMDYPGGGIPLSTGSSWTTSITNNSANWNTAYGWGNHASIGYVTGTPWLSAGFATLASPTFTGTVGGITKAMVGLGNVTNESKATMFTSPILTGTVTIPTPFTLGAVSVTANGTELNVLDNIPGTLTSTELGYTDGVTSPIQTQINAKQDALISGTNIKTVNGQTVLGTGNLEIGEGASMDYPGAGIAVSTGTSWTTSIANNSTNWNTAYTWTSTYGLYASNWTLAHAWVDLNGGNSANWSTAYGWGNHASAGYVTGTPWTAMGYVTGTPWTAAGYAPINNAVFTGTHTIPTPFTLGATSVTANGTELNVLDNIPSTLTSTELGYSDGVTSAIQTQINAKEARLDSIVTVLADSVNIEALLQIDFDTDTVADLSELRLKLDIADTTAMLTPYVNHNDTTAMLNHYTRNSELTDSLDVIRVELADTVSFETIDVNDIAYTPQSTGTVVAGTGITAGMLSRVMYFSTAAAIDITADPQIANGTTGQMITIVGSSDTNTLTLEDGTGLRLNAASLVLGIGDNVTLMYEGTIGDWLQIGPLINN